MSNKKQTFEQGAFILICAAVITKIIGALFKIPLASDYCLGDLGFGYFSVFYDIVSPFIMLSASGLPVAVSRLVAEKGKESEEIFIQSRKVFFYLGIILFSFILLIAVIFLFIQKGYRDLFGILAILPSILFCFTASAYRGYYEGVLNMTPPAISSLIEAVFKLFLGFGSAYITVKITSDYILGGIAALASISIGTLVSLLFLHFSYLKQHRAVKLNNGNRFLRVILITALPIAIASLSGNMVSIIDGLTVRYSLSRLFREEYNSLSIIFKDLIAEFNGNTSNIGEYLPTVLYGIKSKAFTVYNLIPTLVAFLGVGAVPYLTESFTNNNTEEFGKNLIKILKTSSFVCFPASVGIVFLNSRIMTLLFGESQSALIGGRLLMIYGITAVFSSLSLVFSNILQAIGKIKNSFISVIFGLVLKTALNLILCGNAKINIYGSAVSTLACFVSIFVINLFFILKQSYYKPNLSQVFLKPLVGSLISGISAFVVSLLIEGKIGTLTAVLTAILIYFLFAYFLKIFEREEISDFPFGKMLISLMKSRKIK